MGRGRRIEYVDTLVGVLDGAGVEKAVERAILSKI
jgi:hypothetical protein